MKDIIIRGLSQNNLKNISLSIPKHKIIVFTGVSGSGKSSIVFDTIAAESARQMNETYPAFVRSRMPKYPKPDVERIENLTASVIVDQSSLGGNARSTVGTITNVYTDLRILFSRIGKPYVGTASYFSFNDPNGMCPVCSGLGKTIELDLNEIIDFDKSWNQGCIKDSTFAPNSWYWKQYVQANLFNLSKPIKEFSEEEYNIFLYGAPKQGGKRINPKIEGIYNKYNQMYVHRDISTIAPTRKEKAKQLTKEVHCHCCQGKRLNKETLACKINRYSIADLCDMELKDLRNVMYMIKEPSIQSLVENIIASITRMIDIGLPYLHLNRETLSLSGGEGQRLKIVRYMGSSLTNMTYIFDEPSTGLHPHDVQRMNQLLIALRDKGNTVLVVEHDQDVIEIADEVIDVGMYAGKNGGTIVFQGSYEDLLKADTLTGKALSNHVPMKTNYRLSKGELSLDNVSLHNLKNVSLSIPLGIMNVVTGVAGSGKSTLISKLFSKQYKDDVITINQKPIRTTNRSSPASYLGFFDDIRQLLSKKNKVDMGYFSFNSKGACDTCKGKGVIVTELVYMDPTVNTCEACNGKRYSDYALSLSYQGKNIFDILSMSVTEAIAFFSDQKWVSKLAFLEEVGLSYVSLGQPLSTLSGGEIQRIKLAKHLRNKKKIYILDEPTTGLHPSDVAKLLQLFNHLVDNNNTVIIIEHNIDVIKQADYIIDVGPNGGKDGGKIVFTGTPLEMCQVADTLTAKYLKKECKDYI